MLGFTLRAQRPPEPRPVAPGVVQRLEHVFEVDPAKMQIVHQEEFPVWDTMRIVRSRWDHLRWMHEHWADSVISGEELLREEAGEGG
jgi:hypothetical protein